jgi:hypothetical protein
MNIMGVYSDIVVLIAFLHDEDEWFDAVKGTMAARSRTPEMIRKERREAATRN